MVGGIGKAAKSSKNFSDEIAEAAANQKASREMTWETASTPTAAYHPNAPVAQAQTGPYNAIPNAPPMKFDANGKLDLNGGKVDAPGIKADAPSKGWSWKQKAAALALGGFGVHALMGGGGAGAAGGLGAGGLGAGGAGGMGANPLDPLGLQQQTANLGEFMTPGIGYQMSKGGGGVNSAAGVLMTPQSPTGLGSLPTGNLMGGAVAGTAGIGASAGMGGGIMPGMGVAAMI